MKKLSINCLPNARQRALILLSCLSAVFSAQALTITNGVQTYPGLTNTTVTMSGRCELRLTASSNVLSGCTINLASSNAWLFLTSVRPSSVSNNYLSQVLINGSTAVVGGNCRLDEYVMGSVIVPHSPGILPLRVFTAPYFQGNSNSLALYTYYTNAVLGTAFRWNISSFHLQRGYSATFAQNVDGTGASKVYVAQDGDLDVAVMPTNLDHQCNYVRVFPWRWTGKKGWGGAADSIGMLVDPLWNYDWNNATNSTIDTEYVPMKWGGTTTWDPLANLNSKQSSTHALGYNEPDLSAQANVTVSNAIALWPYMMQSGLRLGAPAISSSGVSGQGLDWLYSFMGLATNLGYRVDFVPVHFYKCAWTTTQFSNYLATIYQVTGRPVWVTEFNYGEDSCTSISQSTEASMISSYITMMENLPFVERYAIYSWFGTNRAMEVSSVLTPAGTNYLKQQSTMAYRQEVPPGSSRGIAQYQFENNALDSSGFGNNGCAANTPGYAAGHTGQAIALDGTNSYVQLPSSLGQSNAFTFAAWVCWNGGTTWQRIFDFGAGTSQYMFLTPDSSSGTLRFAMTTNTYSNEQIIETTGLTSGQWCHVALTLSNGVVALYTNGVLAVSSNGFTINPSLFKPSQNYLGKSQFSADPLFNGLLDEVQIADTAFSAAQIAALLTNTPPQFTNGILPGAAATQLVAFTGSIAGAATDAVAGATLTYSKAVGPAWLTVASDGTLSGTPTMTDGGTNNFVVRVTDAAGAGASAVFAITIPYAYGNGTWFVDTAAKWSTASAWIHGCPANGAGLTADFSILDISANRTVTLDSSRSIGCLKFGDYSGSSAWILSASSGSVLTLDSGSATSPAILVGPWPTLATSNAATISASLAGTNGFTKSGWGNLYLTGGNPLSGTLNVDTGSTTANDGAVCLASAGAGTNLTAIAIRDSNGGCSTLQFSGGAVLPAAITLNGRNTNAAAMENVSGSNSLTGNLTINVGGGYYLFQSDAGTLNLGGVISSVATGARTLTFQGAGDHFISGSIQNSNATVSVIKQDGGNLILANTNTFSGALAVGGGAVMLAHPLAAQSQAVNLGCAGTNTLKFGPITGAAVASLAGIGDVFLTNASGAAVTLTNGGSNAGGTFGGAFRGSGSVVKTGSGTWTLAGTNTYTGATVVAGGALKCGAATNVIAALEPVLWLSFNVASGSVITNWGYGGWGMNGSIIGNGAYITNAGRWGGALYIDGNGTNTATNVVIIPSKVVDTSVSGNWSVGCWIKTTTAGAVIMYQGDGTWSSSGQTTYLLNADSSSTAGTYAGAVRWAGGFLTGSTALNDGTWHFIMLVDSGGTETIYVDGNSDSTSSTMSMALASGANQIWIGGAPDSDTGACKMSGFIDDVCIFSRALSQSEIRAIFTNAPVAGKLSGASAVSVASGATLDLGGISQTVAALSDYNGAGGIVTNGAGTPVTLVCSNLAATTASFSGTIADAAASNAISLVKTGGGAQTLSGASAIRGATTVSNGLLVVNGTLGTNAVAVRGGALSGNGVLGGAVTVYAGGTLSPGSNSIGALTIGGSLTFASGGTNFMEINKSLQTNDVIAVSGALTYGGTLVVTNLAGDLRIGDSFRLFTAGSFAGSFSALNLSSPGSGLAWNTGGLTNGVLTVVMGVVAPQFGQMTQAGTNLTFSGSGGAAGASYSLLWATNLMLPLTNWSLILTGAFDNTGNFTLTNNLDPLSPGQFYELRIP